MRKEGAGIMKCEEILELIVDYHDKSLEEKVFAEVSGHLSQCEACRTEYRNFSETLKQIERMKSNSMKGITAANNFDEIMLRALATNEKKRSKKTFAGLQKLAVIAVAIVILATVMSFTPAAAAIKSAIVNIADYIFEDKGIASSIKNGYGQVVEKSDEHGGLTITVHSVISDENRTVLLLGAKYKGSLEQEADGMNFYGMEITGKSGKSVVGGYSSRFDFDKVNMELSGNIDLGRIKENTKGLDIKVKTTVLSRQESKPLDIKLSDDSLKEINRKFVLDNEMIKDITLKNLIVSGSSLKIEYDVKYTDKKYMVGGAFIKLMKEDGTECFSSQSGMSVNTEKDEDTGIFLDVYDISGLDLSVCKLRLEYQKPIKVIDGAWNLEFDIDNKAAKDATLTIKPNRSFHVGNYPMKITKVTLSPSETSVCIESKEVNPLLVLGQMELRIKDDEAKQSSGGFHTVNDSRLPYDNYEAEYHFEPVYKPEGLILAIKSASIPEETGFKLQLTQEDEGKEKSFRAGKGEYVVKYRFLKENMTEVTVKDVSSIPGNELVIGGNDIYIENSQGIKLYPELDSKVARDAGNSRYFTFANTAEENSTLYIKAVARYKEIDLEVPID